MQVLTSFCLSIDIWSGTEGFSRHATSLIWAFSYCLEPVGIFKVVVQENLNNLNLSSIRYPKICNNEAFAGFYLDFQA